jgi:serine protease Do
VRTPKNSPRGQLMQKFVLARILAMDGIDIGLFDYDRHNALYFFILNADEQIYLRYGGRDAEDATTYLNLQSLELALRAGLDRHELYKQGKLAKQPRPAPLYPEQITLLKRNEINRGRCVECHMIADYQAQEAELAGKLDRPSMLHPSPDLKTIGIHLNVPKGLLIEKAEGAAAKAGMQAGDKIIEIGGANVLTFGDLQYRYGKTNRNAHRIELTIDRSGARKSMSVELPAEWWLTDTSYRFWSVEPMLFFKTRPLEAEQKRRLNLPVGGFASEVVEMEAAESRKAGVESDKLPMLKPGDIITGVEGVQESRLTQNVERYIKLTKKAGDTITLDLLRDGKPTQIKQNSYRLYYRKRDPSRNNDRPIPRKLKLRIIDGKSTQIKPNSYRLFYRESRPSRNK